MYPGQRIGQSSMKISLSLMFVIVSLLGTFVVSAADLPTCGEIRSDVKAYFRSEHPEISGVDIISKADVAPMFQLDEFAWLGSKKNDILKSLLPPGDYLVTKLRTKRGREFCKKIGQNPLAYSIIDRIRMGGVTNAASKIIDSKDGYEWVNSLASRRGDGRWIGDFITESGIPNSTNFNQPTGRIYTIDMLIDALCLVGEEIASKQ